MQICLLRSRQPFSSGVRFLPCAGPALHMVTWQPCCPGSSVLLEVYSLAAHAGSRTRVTSMGGLYDAATLRALCYSSNVCHITHFCYDLPARALVGGSRATSRGYIHCICLGWTSRCTASIRGGKEKNTCAMQEYLKILKLYSRPLF